MCRSKRTCLTVPKVNDQLRQSFKDKSRKTDGFSDNENIEENTKFDNIPYQFSYIEGDNNEKDGFENISATNKSKVWNHFLMNRIESLAKCMHCTDLMKVPGGSTKSLHDHLQRKHSITVHKLQYKLDQSREESFKFESDQDQDFDNIPEQQFSDTEDQGNLLKGIETKPLDSMDLEVCSLFIR